MTAEGEPRRAAATGGCVRCLHARAQLADGVPEVRRARAQAARGDAEWRQRLQRYERGDMLIVALTATAVIDNDDQCSAQLCFCHEVVWIDRPIAQSVLAERLRELAHRDFRPVGARLRDRGIELSASEETIAVALVIDAAVRERLDLTGAASV